MNANALDSSTRLGHAEILLVRNENMLQKIRIVNLYGIVHCRLKMFLDTLVLQFF